MQITIDTNSSVSELKELRTLISNIISRREGTSQESRSYEATPTSSWDAMPIAQSEPSSSSQTSESSSSQSSGGLFGMFDSQMNSNDSQVQEDDEPTPQRIEIIDF